MPNEALFTQGGNYDAQELRRLIAGIWTATAPGGVISGAVVTAGSGLSVNISAGYVLIYDAVGGAYLGYSTATSTVAISTNAGGSGTRTDTIQATVNDPGSGSTAGELVYSVRTNSSTVSALSIPIATVNVTVADVITITTPSRQIAEVQNVANRTSTTPSSAGVFTATSTVYPNLAARLANIETGIVSDSHSMYMHLTKAQVVKNKDLSDPSNTFPANPSVFPAGMMMMFGGPAAPGGWLLCAGQEVSRTTFAGLFAVIGVTYGPGDGSNTFNVPDMRGRFPTGADSMGGISAGRIAGTTGLPGATMGSQTKTLSAGNLPSHTHSVTVGANSNGHTHAGPNHNHGGATGIDSPGHTHSGGAHDHGGTTGGRSATHSHGLYFQWANDAAGGGSGARVNDIQNQTGGIGPNSATATTSDDSTNHTHSIPSQTITTGTPSVQHTHTISADSGVTGGESATHTHSATAGSTGSGTPVDILPPAIQVNFIIKT